MRSQEYKDTEIIGVDDSSSEGTFEELCKYHSHQPISLYCQDHRENRGKSASINLGLRHAKGEFIAFF